MGWCEKHRVKKTAHWVKLCQTRPEYFQLWEQGRGPGQVKPREMPPHVVEPYKSSGVGTELKLILKRFGIVARTNCKCEHRSQEMDSNGIEWCEGHIEEIIDWLEREAENRSLSLLFTRVGAKILIRLAIKNTKRKQKIMEQQG